MCASRDRRCWRRTLSFREDWQWATGEELTDLPTSTEIAGDQSMLIMPTGPADELESCAIAFDDVIGQSAEAALDRQPLFRAGPVDGDGAVRGHRCAASTCAS